MMYITNYYPIYYSIALPYRVDFGLTSVLNICYQHEVCIEKILSACFHEKTCQYHVHS